MTDHIFCCPGLRNLVALAGERGVSAVLINTLDGTRFRLQSRGIADQDIDKIRPMPGSPDIKINLASETGLQYCPFCGRRLQELIDAAPQAFYQLAQEHRHLATNARSTI
jgi:hypothetical protein